MSPRRVVRVAQSFFDRLDELLPAQRSASGIPSATDFMVHDLPPIIDLLAGDYENVTLAVDDVPGVRVLITAGRLVSRLSVYCVLAADGSVEVIYLELDAS